MSSNFLPGRPAGQSLVGGWLGFPLADWSGLKTSVRFVILFAAITCLTLPVSAATHWLIERPGIAAGKWLLRRLGWSGEKPEGGQSPVKT